MADISSIKLPNGNEYDLKDKKLLSRGEQLVVNGNGMLGDNTNFDRLVFDGSYSNNSPGSFTYLTPNEYINFSTQDFFPINPDKCYEVEIDMITKNHLACMYTYLAFYDVDKLPIDVRHHGYYTGSDAVLTSSCDNNSTQITVDDASFYANLIGTEITISFWDYKNSFGYKYPPHTYTRYTTNNVTIVSVSGNTITFSAKIGGAGVTHAAGTTISRTRFGNTYKYVAAIGAYPNNTSWSHYRGFMEGIDLSGQNVSGKFSPGVAYTKFGFLWNYTKKDDQVWVTNISVREYRDAYTVNGHIVNVDVPSDAEFTDTTDLGSMTGSLTVDHLSPMMSKTFTGVVGTANTDVDCTFFFGTVKPISYYDIWKIKYRVHIHITGNASTNNQYAEARSEATWFGSENTYQAYHHLNHIHSTSYRPAYYNTIYNLKKAGVDAGLGHALGIGLRNSWNAYNSSYPREITI